MKLHADNESVDEKHEQVVHVSRFLRRKINYKIFILRTFDDELEIEISVR